MKTIIAGPVTEETLANASLLMGINPTEFICNGVEGLPPASSLTTTVFTPCPKLPDINIAQSHARMVLVADAVVCVGEHEHLLEWAAKYDLPVYQE